MSGKDIKNSSLKTRNEERTAVLLANFGGPQGYETVKPFLYNLFSDPVILNVRNSLRKPLAWFISNMRDFNSRIMYKCVNGVSPLIPISYIQAEKLQEKFNAQNILADVFVGFRYCAPEINNVLTELKESGYKKAIVLPMFPQYSFTTTGSVQLVLDEWIKNNGNDLDVKIIRNWYQDSNYIEAYTRLIERALRHMDLQSTQIIFSAHSIPMFNIENGDPYEDQINKTVKLIIDRLGWRNNWHITYQSKVGPVKWLEPETGEFIENLAKNNKNLNLVMVPISFVCEHVETIYEIGKLYKDIAKNAGINKFVRIPALNTSKFLIQALYNQILDCLDSNSVSRESSLINI